MSPGIQEYITIATNAGNTILKIYDKGEFNVIQKADHSYLTAADLASHHYLVSALSHLCPHIPIISEENSQEISYSERKNWKQFFLIDPLDGTKEFIKRNGEFTINIALIQNNKPVLGIIHAPALGVTYYAQEQKGAFKLDNKQITALAKHNKSQIIRIIASRSHLCATTQAYIDKLKIEDYPIELVSMGSALKFGMIAENKADVYPRMAPTMEWDIAAGHVIINEVGKTLKVVETNQVMQYNKEILVNPSFIVE